jgi:hypothetical protein
MSIHLLYHVVRGEQGMGMDVSPGNTIVRVLPGGQAEADGLMRAGDVILAVDRCVVDGPGDRSKSHGWPGDRSLEPRHQLGALLREAERCELLVRREDPALARRLRRLGHGPPPFAAPPAGAAPPPSGPAFRLLTIPVGGETGCLGIELSGGAICAVRGLAKRDGLCRMGDLIIAVDGVDVTARSIEIEVSEPVIPAGLYLAEAVDGVDVAARSDEIGPEVSEPIIPAAIYIAVAVDGVDATARSAVVVTARSAEIGPEVSKPVVSGTGSYRATLRRDVPRFGPRYASQFYRLRCGHSGRRADNYRAICRRHATCSDRSMQPSHRSAA